MAPDDSAAHLDDCDDDEADDSRNVLHVAAAGHSVDAAAVVYQRAMHLIAAGVGADVDVVVVVVSVATVIVGVYAHACWSQQHCDNDGDGDDDDVACSLAR